MLSLFGQPAPAPRRRPRDFTRWGGQPVAFADLAGFEAGFDAASGPFTIDLEGLPFDGMFRRGTGGTLFVWFAAALAPMPDRALPVFSWVGQSGLCGGSSLFLSDPALLLSEDLTLGWYLGTRTRPLQPVMERVVACAARACGAVRIAFVGTSGGGFPALWLAGRFPGAAAFVNAPTTTIIGHHGRNAVRRFAGVAIPGGRIEDFPAALDLTAQPPGTARRIITQNAGDTPFVTRHVAPFLRGQGLDWRGGDVIGDDLLVRMGSPDRWGAGHVMPPREVVRVILRALDRAEGPGFAGLDLPALHRAMVAAEAA